MSTDTTITWDVRATADHYIVRWRDGPIGAAVAVSAICECSCLPRVQRSARAVAEQHVRGVAIRHCKVVLPHIRVDDWVFGVSSVSKDGFESPVASAVPGGAFKPYVAPPAKK